MICYCCCQDKTKEEFRHVKGIKRPYCKTCYKQYSREEREARVEQNLVFILSDMDV